MIDAQFLSPRTVLFKIENDQMRQRVLRRHFWHIADIPLVVREWNPSIVDSKPDLTMIPLWVDLKNVPDNLFSEKGLKFLGDRIGSVQRLHPKTERCVRLDVARLLIVVNLEKPLPNKINLMGMDTVIQVSYPWLPSRCSTCHEWGHDEKGCDRMQKGAAMATNISSTSPTNATVLPGDPQSPLGVSTKDSTEDIATEEVTEDAEGEAAWTVVTKTGRQSPVRSANPVVEAPNGSASRFQALEEICEEGEYVPPTLEDAVGQHTVEPPVEPQSETNSQSAEEQTTSKPKNQRHRSRSRSQQATGPMDSKKSVTLQTSRKASLGKH